MSLAQAVKNAYRKAEERNYDTIYWAIDLHGICLAETYEKGVLQFYNGVAVALRKLSKLPNTKIIIWSSLLDEDVENVKTFFKLSGIDILGVNENPECPNTQFASFDKKFYFSIVVDDKAGHIPSELIDAITYASNIHKSYNLGVKQNEQLIPKTSG